MASGSAALTSKRAGRFFVRALSEQPRWQVFPGGSGHTQASGVGLDVADLVYRCPHFLNFADNHPPFRVALPLSQLVGARSPILVAVDETGGVFIVGCPDETTSEAYTTLVVDILGASTKLWRMGYERFSELFVKTAGSSLEELMLLRSRADWDFDQFLPVVEANLERGRFPILVVTANPEGEVRQVISYLNGMNLMAQVVGYSAWEKGGILVVEPMPGKGFVSTSISMPKAAPAFTVPSLTTPRPEPGVEKSAKPVVETSAGEEEVEAKEEVNEESDSFRTPLGALPTEPAKKVAKPPGPGTKPGVMAGKRPPPKPKEEKK